MGGKEIEEFLTHLAIELVGLALLLWLTPQSEIALLYLREVNFLRLKIGLL